MDPQKRLIASARAGDVEALASALRDGAVLEALDKSGWTPLMRAAEHGDEDAVALLLDHGAAAEGKGKFGTTALMIAARYGHVEAMRVLLDRGADVDAGDEAGETALLFAAMLGRTGAVALLMQRGASGGEAALEEAAGCGHIELITLLLGAGVAVDAADRALEYAEWLEQEEAAEILRAHIHAHTQARKLDAAVDTIREGREPLKKPGRKLL